MSGSLLNKGSAALHTIAITIALAILSGQLSFKVIPLSQIQSALNTQLHLNQNHRP